MLSTYRSTGEKEMCTLLFISHHPGNINAPHDQQC